MKSTVVYGGGLIFIVGATGMMIFGSFFTGDTCTGTNSVGNHFSRLCDSNFFIYVGAFACVSFFLMIGLLLLSVSEHMRGSIRMVAFSIFIVYGVWMMCFSSMIWNTPFFTEKHYPPGVNPQCLECPPSTAIP